MKLQVSTKLFYVPLRTYNGNKTMVSVSKVGRKWATLENRWEISIKDLSGKPDAWGVHCQCYLSEEDYYNKVRADKAWQSLRNKMDSQRGSISEEDIISAAKILRISLEDAWK